MPLIAHTSNAAGVVHDLGQHLNEVGRFAEEFGNAFGSGGFARAAGLWHDLGKNSAAFQAKLASAGDGHSAETTGKDRVDHSTAGAIHAQKEFGPLGLPVAFAIAGHHAGLADRVDLEARLKEKAGLLGLALEPADKVVPGAGKPTPPPFLTPEPGVTADEQKRRYEFWIRMLFSCLVDADFLDTEKHFEGGELDSKKRSIHRGNFASIEKLKAKLEEILSKFGVPVGRVNEIRAQVLADCREKGRSAPQGVFTLTAPTGAGKTLAGMTFALEQAVKHGLDRVIVVLPYTSIIDQNAQAYRDVFGSDNVIEHHSSLDPVKETDRIRLACENWDAPIIITTSVQFLESLLANKPSRCRKLHNVANSVVIFDEVQTLPIPHLLPIVDVLKELVRAYRVTLVLSTATQPALQHRRSGLSQVFPGFGAMTEIVSDVDATFSALKRVTIRFPADLKTPTPWTELATQVAVEPRVLVVTHQRKDARVLAELVPDAVHLSALMCPAHRLKVIVQIRSALARDATACVRVVATQLVEAGVDFSFPVVYRALGGFDSIAQAAGRCNRNGELSGLGTVRIFVAESDPPMGSPRDGLEVAKLMLTAEPQIDPLDPRTFDPYFRRLYFGRQLDEKGIQSLRSGLRFKTVAEEFVIIDDAATPVVVPYLAATHCLETLRKYGPNRDRLRSLQPFTVSLYKPDFLKLEEAGALELVQDTVYAIRCPAYAHLYDERFGLDLTKSIQPNPDTLFS